MKLIAFDTETHLIAPGMVTPRLVCLTYCDGPVGIVDRSHALPLVKGWLEDESLHLVGHNVSYDLGVLAAEWQELLPLIFRAYEKSRIHDTKIRQQLLDIAGGTLKFSTDINGKAIKTGFSLADLVRRYLGRDLPKADTWRLHYARLDGIDLKAWPKEALNYALEDAVATWEVFAAQQAKLLEDELDLVPNEAEQTRAAWSLHLMTTWGVRTDGEATAILRAKLEKEQAAASAALSGTGILRDDGTKDMAVIRALVKRGFEDQNLKHPTTNGGDVSTSEEALRDAKHPHLITLADSMKGAKLLSTYIPTLERGVEVPICARYGVLVESGRTSCGDPNMQNPPRTGGVRECFIPRPGYLFCAVDYDTLELRALAQVCLDVFGSSAMAEALRLGEDLHLNLAADMEGIPRARAAELFAEGDERIAESRQLAKIGNFGFPGGMVPRTFIEYAAGYGVIITEELSQRLHAAWLSAWPEMPKYFYWIKSMVGPAGEAQVVHVRSGRVRGGVGFCQAANSFFQGLAADGAKEALWTVSQHCYVDPKSPLFGSRPVMFLHDEIIVEVPEHRAHEAAEKQAAVMIAAMRQWIPDVPITCKPVLMRRWFKGAKPLYVGGRLVPVRPEKAGGKTVWIDDVREPRRRAA